MELLGELLATGERRAGSPRLQHNQLPTANARENAVGMQNGEIFGGTSEYKSCTSETVSKVTVFRGSRTCSAAGRCVVVPCIYEICGRSRHELS
jgi:hypothetical protein